MPSRDYYLKASSEGDLKAYHRYMTQTAILLGAKAENAAKELERVVLFEKKLANVSRNSIFSHAHILLCVYVCLFTYFILTFYAHFTSINQSVQASLPEVDRHDTSAIYRKLTLGELQREVPQLNWREYLQVTLGDVELKDDEEVVSYAMPYLVEMGNILNGTDRRVVHNYIMWRLVRSLLLTYDTFVNLTLYTFAIFLSYLNQVMSIMTHMIDNYQRERVEFRKILLGIQSERHRW